MAKAPEISTRARAYLRSLAHPLEPVVQIGAEGITDGVKASIGVALEHHELVKVRLGQNFVGERRAAARALADELGADLVQVIGRVVVLFRPRKGKGKQDGRDRIVLP